MAHENIIKLIDYSECETEFLLVMEYANQPTYLVDLINEQHTPVEDEKDLQVYALDILRGLNHIHNQGYVHCDIKVDNMLLHKESDDEMPIVKICDFGLAHVLDPETGRADKSTSVGTWGYIAPEVSDSDTIGPEIDMWSYGLLLYELAVAYKPTQVNNYEYGTGDIPFRKPDWRRKKAAESLQSLIVS